MPLGLCTVNGMVMINELSNYVKFSSAFNNSLFLTVFLDHASKLQAFFAL
jgi:hypothetical protein